MGYFQVRYDSRVVNYDSKLFIRLATAQYLLSAGLTRTSKQNWIHERYFTLETGKVNATTGEKILEPFLLTADAKDVPSQ